MRKGAVYIAIAAAIFASCQKELCYDHTHDSRLEVRFDWSRSTPDDATAMRAYLFPQAGGKPLTADFAGTKGGMMDANYGGYSAIGVSQPDGTTQIVADRYEDAYVIATETELVSDKSFGMSTRAPMPDGAEDDTVRMQPSFLYADTCSHMTVSSVNRVLTMPMTMTKIGEKKIGGRLLVFGHCPHEEIHRHVLTIYTILDDGKKYYFNNEVTDKMHDLVHPEERPHDNHIEIIIPNLPIPEPVEQGDFNVNIEDWTQGGENNITIEN